MRALKAIAVLLVLLAVVGFAWTALNSGVRVTVTNTGDTTLTGVEVRVKGQTYALGELGPGDSDSVKVVPTVATGEVQVWWKSASGKSRQGRVEADVDPGGTHGTVDIGIDDHMIREKKVDVGHGFF